MKKIIKVIHVEDSEIERVKFETAIAGFKYAELAASFDSAEKAIEYCADNPPDLVIADIELVAKSGIWLAAELKNLGIPFAFLTIHENHAIEAFKLKALHYLQKPLVKTELADLFLRVLNSSNSSFVATENYTPAKTSLTQRIFVNTQKQIIVVQLNEVVYINAEGSYSYFHMADGTKIVSGKTMKTYTETILNNPDFVQIHRSYIINLQYLEKILKKKLSITFRFSNQTQIQVATFRKGDWLSKFGY